jgi:hypothetical protein
VVILSIGWSSVAQAEVPLPSAEDIKTNPNVAEAIEDAWEDSQINSYDNRHEEGGWILQNTETGELKVVRVPPGTRDRIEVPYPPSEEGWRAVGFFHTHPSPPKDEMGDEWEQGPSDTDTDPDNSLGVPEIVRNRENHPTFGPERGTYPPTSTPLTPTPSEGSPLSGTWEGTYYLESVFEGVWTETTDTEAKITICLTQKGQDVTGIIILSDIKESYVSESDLPSIAVPQPEGYEPGGGLAGKIDADGNLNLTYLVLETSSYTPHLPYMNQEQYVSVSISGNSMTFNFGLQIYHGATTSTTKTGRFTVTKVSDQCTD